jgi:hypothetical protein
MAPCGLCAQVMLGEVPTVSVYEPVPSTRIHNDSFFVLDPSSPDFVMSVDFMHLYMQMAACQRVRTHCAHVLRDFLACAGLRARSCQASAFVSLRHALTCLASRKRAISIWKSISAAPNALKSCATNAPLQYRHASDTCTRTYTTQGPDN